MTYNDLQNMLQLVPLVQKALVKLDLTGVTSSYLQFQALKNSLCDYLQMITFKNQSLSQIWLFFNLIQNKSKLSHED